MPLPDEQLVVKTDKPQFFVEKDQRALKPGELVPREGERAKSAWAYSLHAGESEEIDPWATLELHALAILVSASSSQIRNRIVGVRFSRALLQPAWVIEDRGRHLVEAHDETHRSLQTGEPAIAGELLAQGDFQEWTFTRDQLAPLLKRVVDAGLVRQEFQPVAIQLLQLSGLAPPA